MGKERKNGCEKKLSVGFIFDSCLFITDSGSCHYTSRLSGQSHRTDKQEGSGGETGVGIKEKERKERDVSVKCVCQSDVR